MSVAVSELWRAEAALHMVTPLGFYIEDYSDLEEGVRRIANIDLIEEDLLRMDRNSARVHVYFSPHENPVESEATVREFLTEAGFCVAGALNPAPALPASPVSPGSHASPALPASPASPVLPALPVAFLIVGSVREEDWANNWKRYFKPLRVGKTVLICPEWENLADYDAGLTKGVKALVKIDPGMAFGTGGHVSTRLCLTLLEEYLAQGADVLDVGTGSGILAITSVLLGAKSALGVDIDEYAVRNARQNAAMNGVSDRVSFLRGDLTSGTCGQYGIILANIVADVIIRLFKDAGRLLKRDGVIICSGIIAERERDVIDAAVEHGLETVISIPESGWAAICFKKA